MSEEKIEKGEQTPILNEKIYNQHDWRIVSFVLVAFMLFVCVIGFNGLLFTPFYSYDIFNNTSNDLLDVLPATWTWCIWFVIYIVQFIWIVYGLFSLFRVTTNGSYLYLKPDFLFHGMYICIIINFIANICWCFWNFKIAYGLFFNVVIMFSMYVFLFISCRKMFEHHSEMEQLGLKRDIWFVRVFIHNGCAIYATWSSLECIFNFGQFLVSYAGVVAVNASTFSLVIILLATLNYFIFENFVWRDYLRHMYTPYIVIIWTLVGCITKNIASPYTRNNIVLMIVLVVVVCLLIARFVLNFFYKTKYPEGFNFNKLIKVNKIFKSSRSGSQEEHEQEQSEQP